MANETAIDIAIRDTKLRLENAQNEAALITREVAVLEKQLETLEIIRKNYLDQEKSKKERERQERDQREIIEYMMG